jgi:hypothetical protein
MGVLFPQLGKTLARQGAGNYRLEWLPASRGAAENGFSGGGECPRK